jgi:ribosomal protein L31E
MAHWTWIALLVVSMSFIDWTQAKTKAPRKESQETRLKPVEVKPLDPKQTLTPPPHQGPRASSYTLHRWLSGSQLRPKESLLQQARKIMAQTSHLLTKNQTLAQILEDLKHDEAKNMIQNFIKADLNAKSPQVRLGQSSLLVYTRGQDSPPDRIRSVITERNVHFFYNGVEITRRSSESLEGWRQRVFPDWKPLNAQFSWLIPKAVASPQLSSSNPWFSVISIIIATQPALSTSLPQVLSQQTLPMVERYKLRCESQRAEMELGQMNQETLHLQAEYGDNGFTTSRLYRGELVADEEARPSLLEVVYDNNNNSLRIRQPSLFSSPASEAVVDNQPTPLTLELYNTLVDASEKISYPPGDRLEFAQDIQNLGLCLHLEKHKIRHCRRHLKNRNNYRSCVNKEIIQSGLSRGPDNESGPHPLRHLDAKAEVLLVTELATLMNSEILLHDFPPYPGTGEYNHYRLRLGGMGEKERQQVYEQLRLRLNESEPAHEAILNCLNYMETLPVGHSPASCQSTLFEHLQKLNNQNRSLSSENQILSELYTAINKNPEGLCQKTFLSQGTNEEMFNYHFGVQNGRRHGDMIANYYELMDNVVVAGDVAGRCCADVTCSESLTQTESASLDVGESEDWDEN